MRVFARLIARRLALGALAARLALAMVPNPASAQVRPGDFITPQNAYKVKDLVSPGVFIHVKDGMTMKIVPSSRIDWPPPYKDATEKYSQQVRLSSDHRSVVGYVAGQPFPLIDPNDPYVADKIVWNNVFRPIQSDDYDLRFFDCFAHYESPGKANSVEIDDTTVGHYAGYSEVGRTEVEPIPIDPDFKTTGRYWLFGLYPVIAPASERGTGLIRFRYADPNKGDDSWTYNPTDRRLRRLNEAILSDATGVSAWNPDHYSGFNPKTEAYSYKLLGEKDMLGVMHAAHSPEIPCATDGQATQCPEVWEMRHMYVLQANPRYSVVNTLQGPTVIYMDSEAWFEPYVDTYDQKGQLFQNFMYFLAYRDRPVPDARVAIYPFKRMFVVGAASLECDSGLSNVCYLPSPTAPERECWYINMGAVNKDFFTPLSMRLAAKNGRSLG